jgi:hypothetical protein
MTTPCETARRVSVADTHRPAGTPGRNEMGGPDQLTRQPVAGDSDLATLAGITAVVFLLVYFASELMEVAQGNFSTARLALAYIGEAGIALVTSGRPYRSPLLCSGRRYSA